MSAHAKGCICRKCRAVRKRRFPVGCLLCFVQPRLPDQRHCAACAEAQANKQALTRERIKHYTFQSDAAERRERRAYGKSLASHARMLGHA